MKYRITAGLLGSTAFGAAQAQDQSYEWTLAYLSVKGTIYEEVALAIPDRIAEQRMGRFRSLRHPRWSRATGCWKASATGSCSSACR